MKSGTMAVPSRKTDRDRMRRVVDWKCSSRPMLPSAGAMVEELTDDKKLNSETGTMDSHLRPAVQFLGCSGSSGPSHVTCRLLFTKLSQCALAVLANREDSRMDAGMMQAWVLLTRFGSVCCPPWSMFRAEPGCPCLRMGAPGFAAGVMERVEPVPVATLSSPIITQASLFERSRRRSRRYS